MKRRILAGVVALAGACGAMSVAAQPAIADDGPGAGVCIRVLHELRGIDVLFINILTPINLLDPIRASLFGVAPNC